MVQSTELAKTTVGERLETREFVGQARRQLSHLCPNERVRVSFWNIVSNLDGNLSVAQGR